VKEVGLSEEVMASDSDSELRGKWEGMRDGLGEEVSMGLGFGETVVVGEKEQGSQEILSFTRNRHSWS